MRWSSIWQSFYHTSKFIFYILFIL
jgi:hypothetical protein